MSAPQYLYVAYTYDGGRAHSTLFCGTQEDLDKWLEQDPLRELKSQELRSGILAVDQGNQFVRVGTGMHCLGDSRDCRGAYSHTCYCAVGDEASIAKHKENKAEEARRQDSYYSQPWV